MMALELLTKVEKEAGKQPRAMWFCQAQPFDKRFPNQV
jgi:hypothetical protein